MRSAKASFATVALFSAAAYCDISIRIPAVTVVSDTALVKEKSGIGVYLTSGGPGSTAVTSLEGGVVKFDYNVSAGAGSYAGATGMLVPLEPSWSGHNILKADSIIFEIKADAAGGEVNLLIGSDLYKNFGNPDAAWQSNLGSGWVVPPTTPKPKFGGVVFPSTTWTRVAVSIADMVISPWYTGSSTYDDAICTASGWVATADGGMSIGSNVKNIQFQPVWNWAQSGKMISNPKGNFYVRNISIHGADLHPAVVGVNCTGTKFKLDQFDAVSGADVNVLGGPWFPYTDADSLHPDALATGASRVVPLSGKQWAPWKIGGMGFGALQAKLEKTTAAGYHKYAGWAALGTKFANGPDNASIPVNLQGLKAMSFDLYVGNADGMLPDSLKWDKTLVSFLSLKFGKKNVGDDVAYSIQIPVSQGEGNRICVDLDSLQQPSTYADAQPWSPDDITQIGLEMKIDDQLDSTIHSAGPMTFAIKDVYLYGLDSATAAAAVKDASVVRPASHKAGGIRAFYRAGLEISYALSGDNARVDVLKLDGTRVAGFDAPAVASSLRLPVELGRGTYIVRVAGQDRRLAIPLDVAR